MQRATSIGGTKSASVAVAMPGQSDTRAWTYGASGKGEVWLSRTPAPETAPKIENELSEATPSSVPARPLVLDHLSSRR
jgi:hypothetical protein